jgi:hypothetical protein
MFHRSPLAALLACLLGSTTALAAEPSVPREGESGRVLWVEPIWPLAYNLLPDTDGQTLLYLPVGLSLPLSERQALTLELSLGSYKECTPDFRHDCYADATFGRFSVGRSFSTGGQQRGAFVQPRVALTLVRTAAWDDDVRGASGSGRLSPGFDVGADVGYQWHVGHLYVATMVGVGVGLFANASDEGLLITDRIYASGDPGMRPTFSFNLNLLRIGWGM